MGCPLTLAIAGPVTVSGQHQAWLIPLLETGWIAYLSTTDASATTTGIAAWTLTNPARSTKSPSTATMPRCAKGTIRVTDMAFDEGVLLDEDRFLSAVLARPSSSTR